jgi:hypothetical protein
MPDHGSRREREPSGGVHPEGDGRGGEEFPAGERVAVVRDPTAAAWLLGPARLRQLEPFLGVTSSVREAADRTFEKPNTVLRRVERLLKLGLIEVVEVVPRAGRAIRRYRTTADVFFVPFEATGADSLESALAERDAERERLLRRNVVRARREALGSWGTRIYRDARGRLQVQTAVSADHNVTLLDDDMPAALSAWRDELYLDFADAKRLQRELFELVLRYSRRSGAQRYIVHVGLAAVLGEGRGSRRGER